jgi:YbgC/YbaW family acyl-CoA thioester hydrolase
MVVIRRQVRFDEVDAAGLVFFARYAAFAHEAMEAFFDGLEGGYVALITRRRVGLPAVKLESQFHAPLRYGDAFRVEIRVARVGGRSAVFHYRVVREVDEVLAAEMHHTVVTTDLDALRSIEMPADVRAALERG